MKYLVKVVSAILIAVSSTFLFATTNIVLADAEKREIDKNEIECLALNIYFETSAVSLADAIAVSDVVMNRINSARYPDTVCEVVKQGHNVSLVGIVMVNPIHQKIMKHGKDLEQ